jgi:hypothetical protein
MNESGKKPPELVDQSDLVERENEIDFADVTGEIELKDDGKGGGRRKKGRGKGRGRKGGRGPRGQSRKKGNKGKQDNK